MTNGTGQMYYLHKDHLGSLDVITNANGAIVEEHSFDAWGRRRNPNNWKYENIAQNNLLDRGYTGHEHLDQFNLINMNACVKRVQCANLFVTMPSVASVGEANGRMYDPIVARFLSPDKYVQSPDFTQSYNRYSYVFNNPLKYTDPTGWIGSNTTGGAGESYSSGGWPSNQYDSFGRAKYDSFTGMFIPSHEREGGASAKGYGDPRNGQYVTSSSDVWWVSGSGYRDKNGAYIEVRRHYQKGIPINETSWAWNSSPPGGGGIPNLLGNTINATNNATGYFQAAYLIQANHKSKYAQRINGKVRAPEVLSRANRMNNLSAAKGVSRFSSGLTMLSIAVTTTDGITNGWQNHHTADLVVTGAIYGTAAAFPVVGWIAGGLYFVADLTTQYYTGKSITQNLFDK